MFLSSQDVAHPVLITTATPLRCSRLHEFGRDLLPLSLVRHPDHGTSLTIGVRTRMGQIDITEVSPVHVLSALHGAGYLRGSDVHDGHYEARMPSVAGMTLSRLRIRKFLPVLHGRCESTSEISLGPRTGAFMAAECGLAQDDPAQSRVELHLHTCVGDAIYDLRLTCFAGKLLIALIQVGYLRMCGYTSARSVVVESNFTEAGQVLLRYIK